MKLAVYCEESFPVSLTIGCQTLEMEVRAGKLTPAYMDNLADRSIADCIPELVSSWDLMGEGDSAIALTQEAISELPLPLQRVIWKGLMDTIRPN